MVALRTYFLVALIVSTLSANAQQPADTIRISLQQAGQMFAQNNLRLLAAKFNIDASRAAIVQAQLWNNPSITIEQNVYNWNTKRYFDVGIEGNTEIQVFTIVLLAGKRDKQIRLAEINSHVAELTFYDLLRTLTLQLRGDFYSLYFLRQSLAFYDESVSSIRKTVAAVESIYEKRAILLSEVLRLKALLFSLEKDRLSLLNQISEKQQDLRILLHDSTTIHRSIQPEIDTRALDTLSIEKFSLEQIRAAALDHRPDYKIVEESVQFEETNLALQKALRIPDITIGGRWSRAGSYIREYYALTVGIDLPLFNRNQGNIAVSENTLEANKRMRDYTRRVIEKDVTTAYQKAVEIDKLYKSFDKKFVADYKQLIQGMIVNYEKRNISIIEFTDFFESYRANMLQMNQLQSDRIDAFDAVNYAVGINLVQP